MHYPFHIISLSAMPTRRAIVVGASGDVVFAADKAFKLHMDLSSY
jgi:hypothetical protein